HDQPYHFHYVRTGSVRQFYCACTAGQSQELTRFFRRSSRNVNHQSRGQLALSWISLLQGDLITLWRFRRFLIQEGVPSSVKEELGTLQALVLSLVLLNVLRVSIRTVGPFALPRATRQA